MKKSPNPFISPDPIMPPCFRVSQLTPSDGPSRPRPLPGGGPSHVSLFPRSSSPDSSQA